MSQSKAAHRRKGSDGVKTREWPVVVYMWIFGLTIISYVIARAVLDGKPHPIHWLAALLGGLAGIPIGWLWYRWRGDVI
jgi:hypothetical protein